MNSSEIEFKGRNTQDIDPAARLLRAVRGERKRILGYLQPLLVFHSDGLRAE